MRTRNSMRTEGISIADKSLQYNRGCFSRLLGEISQHRIRRFRADDGQQLFAGGAADAGEAAEGHEERAPPARADARHAVELRAEVAHAARLAVEAHCKSVRLVANRLQQPERRIVFRE